MQNWIKYVCLGTLFVYFVTFPFISPLFGSINPIYLNLETCGMTSLVFYFVVVYSLSILKLQHIHPVVVKTPCFNSPLSKYSFKLKASLIPQKG